MAQQECFSGEAVSHCFFRDQEDSHSIIPTDHESRVINQRVETQWKLGPGQKHAVYSWSCYQGIMGTGRILTKRGFGTGAAGGSVPPVCHLLPSRGSWVRNGSTSESGIGQWLETSPSMFICQGICSEALQAERLTQHTSFLTSWRSEV